MPNTRLKIPLSNETWMLEADCINVSQELFFPAKDKTQSGKAVPEAYMSGKRVCNSCQVQSDCLAYALGNHIDYGLWGGLTPPERNRLVRNRG